MLAAHRNAAKSDNRQTLFKAFCNLYSSTHDTSESTALLSDG